MIDAHAEEQEEGTESIKRVTARCGLLLLISITLI